MRTLKILLVIGGLLIVAGFAFLGFEVYKRSVDPNHPRSFAQRFKTEKPADTTAPGTGPAPAAEAPPMAPLTGLAQPLILPAGAELLPGIASVGGRIALQVRQPDGQVQILLVDPRDGAATVLVTTTP